MSTHPAGCAGDGIIHIGESVKSFASIGFTWPNTWIAPVMIHLFLSYATLPSPKWKVLARGLFRPNTWLPIYTDLIAASKQCAPWPLRVSAVAPPSLQDVSHGLTP